MINLEKQFIHSLEKPILYLSVAVLAVMTILPLLDVGFTTNDDTLKGLWAQGDYWKQGLETAKYLGRFTHFTSMWLKVLPYFFGIESWFYKLCTFGMFFIACIAFGYCLKFFSKSNNTGILSLIFVFAFIQNSWEHNLLTSYPFYYNLRFAMLMIAMVIFYKGMERESKILLYVFAFMWFFVITEGFLQYAPIFIILIVVIYYKKNKISITGIIAFSLPVIIFLTVYVGFRLYFPSHYEGNILSDFNLIRILKTNFQLSVSGVPGYYFFVAKSAKKLFYEGFPLYSLIDLLRRMRWEWVVRFFIVLFSIFIIFLADDTRDRKKLIIILLISLISVFLPNVLVSLTTKYQAWVNNGTKAYIYSYFSFFAVCSFLTCLVLLIKTYIPNQRAKIFYAVLVSLAVALLCLITDYHNYFITKDQTVSQRKWQMVNTFIKSDAFKRMPNKSVIFAPSLYQRRGIVSNYDGYWSDYIYVKTQKRVFVINEIDQLKQYSNKDLYFLKLFWEYPCNSHFLLFAKIDDPKIMKSPKSKEIVIYNYDLDRDYFVYGIIPKAREPIYIDNKEAGRKGSLFYQKIFFNNKAKRDPEIEIQSKQPIDIYSITINAIANGHDRGDFTVNYSYGWSYEEKDPKWIHRWSVSKNAVINIFSMHAKKAVVKFRLTTLINRKVKIYINEKFKNEFDLELGKEKSFREEIILEEGINTIEFLSDVETSLARNTLPGNTDTRKISFAIFDFSIFDK